MTNETHANITGELIKRVNQLGHHVRALNHTNALLILCIDSSQVKNGELEVREKFLSDAHKTMSSITDEKQNLLENAAL